MKTLKFKDSLVRLILAGEKTATWRLFDDKGLQTGDIVSFFNKETGKEFVRAKFLDVKEKELGQLTDSDWVGHERYSSEQEMYETLQSFYPGKVVDERTKIKIIKFKTI